MLTLGEVAAAIGGRLSESSACDKQVSGLKPPDVAGESDLCFVRASYQGPICGVAAVIEPPRSAAAMGGVTTLEVSSIDAVLADLVALFAPRLPAWGPGEMSASGAWVAAGAQVAPTATLRPGAVVGPHVTVGAGTLVGAGVVLEAGAEIGCDVILESRAVVGWGCRVGDGARVGRGAIIGAEGFGFVVGPVGPRRVPHIGVVVVASHVEIGANSVIARATLGETRLASHAKLDSAVVIAHNVSVGARSLLAAQVGVAGSATVEDDVRLGGQVGVVGHIVVGSGAQVAAQSGVTGGVAPGAVLGGTPAVALATWRRGAAAIAHLPGLFRRVRALENDRG